MLDKQYIDVQVEMPVWLLLVLIALFNTATQNLTGNFKSFSLFSCFYYSFFGAVPSILLFCYFLLFPTWYFLLLSKRHLRMLAQSKEL